jgi:hypothetical protein
VVVIGALVLVGLSAVDARATSPAARSSCGDPSGAVTLGLSYSAAAAATERATVDEYQAGIDALNREGGLAGCPVETVVFRFDPGAGAEQQSLQECVTFTRNVEVLAVFSVADPAAAGGRCYADAGTPVFRASDDGPFACARDRGDAGYLYAPAGVATCRFGSFVGIWDRAGLFPDGALVGIVIVDDDTGYNRALADGVWARELRARNIPFETMAVPDARSAAEFSGARTVVADGLARFVADGVDVVLFTPSGGLAVAAFMPAAAARGYFPAYGLTSADGLRVASTVGAAAIKRALAISWRADDLPLPDQQRLPANPAIEQCVQWATPSETTVASASAYCDFLNILPQALAGSDTVSRATLRAGIEKLGTTFVSSLTYGGETRFGANRHDGAYRAQVLEFDPATSTFRFHAGARTATIR